MCVIASTPFLFHDAITDAIFKHVHTEKERMEKKTFTNRYPVFTSRVPHMGSVMRGFNIFVSIKEL